MYLFRSNVFNTSYLGRGTSCTYILSLEHPNIYIELFTLPEIVLKPSNYCKINKLLHRYCLDVSGVCNFLSVANKPVTITML